MINPAAPPAVEEPRRRIVILGAGPAGLAAASALTSTPELAARHEVHVYQAGDRPGGKCGTSRPRSHWSRIEQNASHYLFGCYHNAFALLDDAYRSLADRRGPQQAEQEFGSFESEFVPRPFLVGKQKIPERPEARLNWFFSLPPSLSVPGRGSKWPTPFDYLVGLVYFFSLGLLGLASLSSEREPCRAPMLLMKILRLFPFNNSLGTRIARAIASFWAAVINGPVAWLVAGVVGCLRLVCWRPLPSPWQRALLPVLHRLTLRCLELLRGWLRSEDGFFESISWAFSRDIELHKKRARMLADLILTLAIGVIRDRLWRPGALLPLDRLDLREWLDGHGLLVETRQDCPLVQVWYDAVAAYEDAEEQRPRISAAVSLYAMFRATVTYKGALAFQMRNEVGDSFIAPIYQSLVDRGVTFHFFSRIREVVPGQGLAGEPIVTEIEVEQQVPPPDTAPALGTVEGQPGRQLWLDARLQANGETLDSFWAPTFAGRLRLRTRLADPEQGFDEVILALPVAVIPFVCPRILAGSEDWRAMVARVKTTETQSIRFWFSRSLPELGWFGPPPILSAFDWPFSTWEDNDADCILDTRRIPRGTEVKAIATVFGPLEVPDDPAEDVRDQAYSLRRAAIAQRAANRFMARQVGGLWNLQNGGDEPDWGALAAPAGLTGRSRFRWQAVTANVGPLESYTQALPGSLDARLRPDESGYANLFLAGDWTRNGAEVGCLEGAVMSGLQAARSICGSPDTIPGLRDLEFGLFNPW